jgi:radical SAM superfamily enzyme YgiQ (UPF0313 family)
MKLALITPKSVFFSNDDRIARLFESNVKIAADSFLMPQRGSWSGGSLGLLIVAALTPPDFEIIYIDENYEEINFDAGYDLVGISAMTQQAARAYEIADEFRKRRVKVVAGGIHATVMPEEAKEHTDAVVIGEAENTWPELIDDFGKKKMKSFYISTAPADLTKSPIPKYDLLAKYDYKIPWIQTSRGCPRDCEFCAASKVYGKKHRHKTVDQVMREINYVRGLWNEPLIYFADDNMFLNRSYAYELVTRLKNTELRWLAQTDVSAIEDDEFLDLLRVSHCKMLFLGFETLSHEGKIDKHGWKQKRIEKYPEIIKRVQSRGIGVLGSFIIGLDSDDSSIFESLSDFIINNRLYAAQVFVLTPLPGTRLRERLLKENRILSSDWAKYTFFDVNFMPKKIKPEELQAGILEIYKRIYTKEARMAVVNHFKKIYTTLYKTEVQCGD